MNIKANNKSMGGGAELHPFPRPGSVYHRTPENAHIIPTYIKVLKLFGPLVISLYRLRIWPLFGWTTYLLTIPGRKSGRLITTPLEYSRKDGKLYGGCSLPAGGQWWKNAQANPDRVRAQIGFRSFDARLDVCSDEEAVEWFRWYVKKHPAAAKVGFGWDPKADDPETADFVPILNTYVIFRIIEKQRQTPTVTGSIVRFFFVLAKLFYHGVRYGLIRSYYALFSFLWSPEEKTSKIKKLNGLNLLQLILSLGATATKFGQMMSTRKDMLAAHIVNELEKLQDEVAPFPAKIVKRIIEEDLGRPVGQVFSEFSDKSIAAASIAQVHEARLHSGERVAVKVMRPNVGKNMGKDLAILRFLARLVDLIPRFKPMGVPDSVAEIADSIQSQLDFNLEIANNYRLAEGFADIDWVSLPEIYEDYCGERVITMGFIDGKKLTDALDNPPIPRVDLAKRIVEMYMLMSLRNFFIHSDMHPGNVFVDDKGDLILIDTGLVTEIEPAFIGRFFRSALAMMLLEGRLVAQVYLEGHDNLSEDQVKFACDGIEAIFDRLRGAAFTDVEVGELFFELFGIFREVNIKLESSWAGMLLSEITFEGIANQVDSDFNMMLMMSHRFPQFIYDTDILDVNDEICRQTLYRTKASF